jgi:parallel beta-helix repeat protein
MNKPSLVPAIAIAMVTWTAASAQLSGTYTVDANLPTGAGNYATLAAAAADLSTLGVSGPVVFQVYPNATPYTGFAIALNIAGSSATNTVTFQGLPGAMLAGVAATWTQVIRLGPAALNTSVFAGPQHVIIDGFDITVPASGAGIIITGSTSCVVRNCFVHGSGTGAGIAIVNSQHCLVENNEVANTAATPGSPGSASYCGGISVYYTGAGNVITRNKVHDCTQQGIFLGTSGATTAPADVTCTNNFVWNCTGAGTYSGGIAIRRLTGDSIVANNSVWMPAGTGFPGIHQTGAAADPQPTLVANNVVRHDGSGGCFKFEATTIVPSLTFDYNLYFPGPGAFVGQVATLSYATLPAWQAVTGPNLAGKEVNTLVGDPLFAAANDLHVPATSPAFNNGLTIPSVTVDIDNQPRPMNGLHERGADETQGAGLFAQFAGSPTSGGAPLTVGFGDQSATTAPGGLTSWAWDFQNDGFDDSFVQNPTFVYSCPGLHSVKLTVNDGVHPTSSIVKQNYVSVAQQPFVMTTTGGGVGDLSINAVGSLCHPTAVQGWTLVSFSPQNPVGGGPFAGLYPDAVTINFINYPAAPGVPMHFLFPAPGLYPNVPFNAPAGSLSFLAGTTIDAVEVLVGPAISILRITNVVRLTF